MGWLMTRDEREARIDDSADRVAYLVLSYGLLGIVAYRSFVDHAASWDLLALVVLGGAVGTIVRLRRHALTGRWLAVAIGSLLIAAILAVVIAFALPRA